MYVDSQLLFSDAQAVTASAASTNYIDLGIARSMGVGRVLYLVVLCVVAMTDSGSDSTINVDLETDDNTSFSSASVVQDLGTFAALSAVGTRLVAALQLEPANAFERYARVYYTAANGNLTTGSFDAFICLDVAAWSAYAAGYTVS
jgi:hypothetical protein